MDPFYMDKINIFTDLIMNNTQRKDMQFWDNVERELLQILVINALMEGTDEDETAIASYAGNVLFNNSEFETVFTESPVKEMYAEFKNRYSKMVVATIINILGVRLAPYIHATQGEQK